METPAGTGRKASPDLTADAHLAAKAQNGDREAFSLLVTRYQRPVFNLCLRHLARPDAEDVAQETFVRAFVHIRRFDPVKPLLPWLFTIARRLCIDRLRKKAPVSGLPSVQDSVRQGGPDTEQLASAREQVDRLMEGLRQLPDGQREALALFHLEGLSYRDIASVLGVPEGTVMTWLHRGRAQLKKLIRDVNGPADGKPSTERREDGTHP